MAQWCARAGPAVTAVLSIVHMGLLLMVSIKDKLAACAEFVILDQALFCVDLTNNKCYLLHHPSTLLQKMIKIKNIAMRIHMILLTLSPSVLIPW